MGASDLELRRKELEQAALLHSEQYKHHLSEAQVHERELEGIRNRLDEIDRYLNTLTASKKALEKTAHDSKGNRGPQSSTHSRFFHMEGPTTVVVRMLYENKHEITIFEMQARAGSAISHRTLRKIVNRLVRTECAKRDGKKVMLTERGIRLWEASPLFLRFKRDGKAA